MVVARPGEWDLSLSAAYVGERADIDPVSFRQVRLASHLRLDLAARLERWQRLQPYGRIENLADETYQEIAGYPAPGRRLIAGIASSWK